MPPEALENLPIQALKGVGSQTAERLEKLRIRSVQDLLFHLPLRYEDRTKITPIGQIMQGQQALVEGRIELAEVLNKGRRSLICRVSDGTGFLSLRFFHFSAQQRASLGRGIRLRCYGEVRAGILGYEMIHPEYECVDEAQAGKLEPCLTPVYPLTEGVHQKTLRRLIDSALQWLETGRGTLAEWIPQAVREAMALPTLAEAVRLVHKPLADPPQEKGAWAARQRLVFEELLAHHLSFSRLRAHTRSQRAPVFQAETSAVGEFLAALPFSLTGAQRRVVGEIEADFSSGKPMMRLVQGDVGSGKTVVAALAALSALASGYQAALMAPTELLTEQHYHNFAHWLEPLGVRLVWLAGKHRGKARQEVLEAIQQGRAGIAVGTHALFQESVRFFRLGLVIIDEQHRFGVHQRLALREKGLQEGFYPHQLIMTATPIPRTLAMLGYADLDVSVIDELPPGRTPVQTTVIPASRREEVIRRIADWVVGGRQVYWVCTLIEESETLQCEAASMTAEALGKALPSVRIGLVHGRLKAHEKEDVMQAFKARQYDLLVATTVIEVGVDVPNAGLMIIENSERLGLSQLHQLRGRVGRGAGDSYCVLMYQPPLSDCARQRLAILRGSNDGFEIAEKDLELRGPGEVLGTRQTGHIAFRIADLARDKALLPKVTRAAEIMQREFPHKVQPLIRRWLGEGLQYAKV